MRAHVVAALIASTWLCGCANSSRVAFPSGAEGLSLDRVVLYRNGIGYFERRGKLDNNVLRLKVRKDQINDMLKSLTIVDRQTGHALSVSMPLDPDTWASAALAALQPGNGSLATVLDGLRGVEVTLDTTQGDVSGRLVMVEEIDEEPDPGAAAHPGPNGGPGSLGRDHKVTLLEEQEMKVVRLSKVKAVTLKDGDLAMQFHRRLDASAGEGMFQQVDVDVRLDGTSSHDVVVSYVVEAPMWKPTYRVVLPEKGKGDALLQAWAVVDNTSGEDWSSVSMALTAGEPLAFRYDLHTPRRVFREDVSDRVHGRRAAVAMGETTFDTATTTPAPMAAGAPPAPPAAEAEAEESAGDEGGRMANMGPGGSGFGAGAGSSPAKPSRALHADKKYKGAARVASRTAASKSFDDGKDLDRGELPPAFSFDALRQSTLARAKAVAASGQTRFDLGTRVTVPDGTSTMVAIVNKVVKGEETFLYRPGGAGQGYESNPYRVVRFKNDTEFVLESGPISIFSGGSFVGEGISETVGSGVSATIPFAVEPNIMVTRESTPIPEEMKLVKIVRGVLNIERFSRVKTVWKATAQKNPDGLTVLVRHPRVGSSYQLKDRPEGTEELPDAFVVPVKLPAGAPTGMLEIIEQAPIQTTIDILDRNAVELLDTLMVQGSLTQEEKDKLQPVIELRHEMGKIETEIEGDRRQQQELDERGEKTRENLRALERDKSAEAAAMRKDLERRLDDWTKQGDALGRDIVKLESRHLQLKVKLQDLMENLTIGK